MMKTIQKKWLLIAKIIFFIIMPPYRSIADEIENVCKNEISKRPKNEWAFWFIANLYDWKRDYINAKNNLEMLLKMETKNEAVLCTLVRIYYNLGGYEKVSSIIPKIEALEIKKYSKTFYYCGDSYVKLKEYYHGQRFLIKYTESSPNDYIGFAKLGYAYYMGGKYPNALKAYKEANRLNPLKKEITDSIKLCSDIINKGKEKIIL